LLVGLWLVNPRSCPGAERQKFPWCRLRSGDGDKVSRIAPFCRSLTGSGSPVVTNLVNMIVIGKIRPDAPLCSVVVDLPVEIIHSWCVPRRPSAIKPLNFVSLNLTAENPLINVSIQSKIPPRSSTYRWIWLRFGTNLSTPRLHRLWSGRYYILERTCRDIVTI